MLISTGQTLSTVIPIPTHAIVYVLLLAYCSIVVDPTNVLLLRLCSLIDMALYLLLILTTSYSIVYISSIISIALS